MSKEKVLVRETDNIVIIDLKVRDYDKHIWEPLVNTKAKLIYFSGIDGANKFSKWALEHDQKNNVSMCKFNLTFKTVTFC